MERAHHIVEDMASSPVAAAPIVVEADVLCRFLCGEVLTGVDAVFTASTTRLAAGIHTLSEDYGWTIERSDKVVGCKDGRTAGRQR